MHLRHLTIAAMLLATAPAAAQGLQSFQPAPSKGFGAAPAAPQQDPPCLKEFTALRMETEKRGKAVQAAGQHKIAPQEACKLFDALMAAEVKLIKYTDENSKWCGIPPQVSASLKDGHNKVKQVRDRVCHLAAQPARPAGPSLSDALGTTRSPDSSNIKTGHGGGTFDTLTGSPLAK